MKTLSSDQVLVITTLGAVLALLPSSAYGQTEDVTLKGDSLQTLESRSVRDFPGLSSGGAAAVAPRVDTDYSLPSFPQVRLNDQVDVIFRESKPSGDALGLFRSPGDRGQAGMVNVRLQLEE